MEKTLTKPKKIKSPYYNETKNNMSKEITLNISERVALLKILNDFKGNLSTLAKILDDIKKVAVIPKEWEDAELKKTPYVDEKGNPTGQESWAWQDKKELEKTMDLDSDVIDFVLGSIKTREDNKEITMADTALITLKAKL